MLRCRVDLLLATIVAVALLAALPSFALGRDLTTPRMATPDYNAQLFAASATEHRFLLRRGGEPYAISVAGTARAFPTTPPDLAPSYPVSPPVVASNSAGDTAIVTTEFNTAWMIDRAKFYLASDFSLRRRATP